MIPAFNKAPELFPFPLGSVVLVEPPVVLVEVLPPLEGHTTGVGAT